MLDTLYRWCVAAFSSGLWNITSPFYQVLDSHIVQMHVKFNSLCEQQWAAQTASREGIFQSCCVTKNYWELSACSRTRITCASGQATTYTTTPPVTATLVSWKSRVSVEWRSVVFSDERRFCLYASDGRTLVRRGPDERQLPECIHPRHTGPISGFMVFRGLHLQLVTFGVSVG